MISFLRPKIALYLGNQLGTHGFIVCIADAVNFFETLTHPNGQKYMELLQGILARSERFLVH